jgi:hypothetical protein
LLKETGELAAVDAAVCRAVSLKDLDVLLVNFGLVVRVYFFGTLSAT